MKRKPQEEPELPNIWAHADIVSLITQECLEESGALARVNRQLLQVMCSTPVLGKLVEICKTNWRPIPRWLLFPLPSSILLESNDPLALHVESFVLPRLNQMIKQKPLDNKALLTGSFVTSLVYQIDASNEWDSSDIDLFIHRDDDYEHTKIVLKFHSLTWDIVQLCNDIPLHYYPGDFDHSLVQMGFYEDELYIYMTPLALFTKRTRLVTITVNETNLYYLGPTQNGHKFLPGGLDMSEFQKNHQKNHGVTQLHQCEKCIIGNTCHRFEVWCRRIKKYEKRFQGYKFIYLPCPTNQ